jgi:hypothetical protein
MWRTLAAKFAVFRQLEFFLHFLLIAMGMMCDVLAISTLQFYHGVLDVSHMIDVSQKIIPFSPLYPFLMTD